MEKQIRDIFNDEIIKVASDRFGVLFEDVKKVGGFENFIYEFTRDQQDFILRISHSNHRTLEMVEAELDWVDYLAKNGASVSQPIRSINNRLVEKINLEDGSYFLVTAYYKAPGRHVKKEDVTEELIREYGRVIGKLHRLTKDYQPGQSKRIEWDEEGFIVSARSYLPDSEVAIYDHLMETIDQIKKLPQNKECYGLIHTDIHFGNFFINDGNITVFDFDDSAYKWFISDIAIALFYLIANKSDEEKVSLTKWFMKHFISGYQVENQLDPFWFEQLPIFLKLREIILYVVIYRSEYPNFSEWGQNYINQYKSRIENNIPFVDVNFTELII